jgi:methylated-DNA-protein-cysteine methyltransferase-like protein
MPPEDFPTFDKSKAYNYFCDQVYEIVRTIPEGRVMTYGRIASLIPLPEGMDPLAYKRIRARWAGYAIKACPEDVPWWRVVNVQGGVSSRMGHGQHIQPVMLAEEGVLLDANQIIDLNRYLWQPDQE